MPDHIEPRITLGKKEKQGVLSHQTYKIGTYVNSKLTSHEIPYRFQKFRECNDLLIKNNICIKTPFPPTLLSSKFHMTSQSEIEERCRGLDLVNSLSMCFILELFQYFSTYSALSHFLVEFCGIYYLVD